MLRACWKFITIQRSSLFASRSWIARQGMTVWCAEVLIILQEKEKEMSGDS